MSLRRPIRTLADLDHAVRALATEFKADKVFIIGSQGILLGWPDAPTLMRSSPEIDAFPGNARIWEIQEEAKHPGLKAEASEQIDALFGNGSQFHETHGFYIDGVDENTAKLPVDWKRRAAVRHVDAYGKTVTAVAPAPEDLIVSKLARLDDKDKAFVETYHAARPLDLDEIERRIHATKLDPAVAARAIAYVRTLKREHDDGVGGGP